jgi:4-amino-4-deoxy-L-arabinose transferase-like glycosyltransferase
MKIGLAVGIALVALLLRLPGAGQFMTADEENWMVRSAHYWHNLFFVGDAGGTFMTTHPGATAMWLIGAGEVWQEVRLNTGVDTSNLTLFRWSATVPIAVASSVLIGIIAWLAMRLWGAAAGVGGGFFLAVEPYVVGMSQVAHLDALLGFFMLASLLSFLLSLEETDSRYRWLGATGVWAGLALATKALPALWLFVFFTAVMGWSTKTVRRGGFIFGVAMLTFYVVWPALWFTADLGRSFEKDISTVVAEEHVALEEVEEPIAPVSFYVRTVLARVTPWVLLLTIGSLLVGGLLLMKTRKMPKWMYVLLYGLGFLLLITGVAKKGDRYALPALMAFTLVAGMMAVLAMEIIGRKWLKNQKVRMGAGGVLLFLMALHGYLLVPHAIAYNNWLFPNLRPLSQQGWGEGLEEAAEWLNERPEAEKMYVASWYPSVLATYFKGKTFSLSSRNDRRVAYVVTYRNMGGRSKDSIADNVLDEFKGREPVKIIEIAGVPYVWIYQSDNLALYREHIGELAGGVEVGQTVPINFNNWQAIDIGLATFSGRVNTEPVILQIKDSPNSRDVLRTVVISASEIEDNVWHRFQFEALQDSADKVYYVSLTSPQSRPGNSVTVMFATSETMLGEMFLRRGDLPVGKEMIEFVREGADMDYRL